MKYVTYLLHLLILLFITIGLLGLYVSVESYLTKDLSRMDVFRGITLVFVFWSIAAILHFIREAVFKNSLSLIRGERLISQKLAQEIGVTVLVTTVGLWVVYFGLQIRVIDNTSIKDANDNANRVVPHTYDLWMNNSSPQSDRADSTDKQITPEDIAAVKNGQYSLNARDFLVTNDTDVYIMFQKDGTEACLVHREWNKMGDCTGAEMIEASIIHASPMINRVENDYFDSYNQSLLLLIESRNKNFLAQIVLPNKEPRTNAIKALNPNAIDIVTRGFVLSVDTEGGRFIQSRSVSYQEIRLNIEGGGYEVVWVQTIMTKHGPVTKFVRSIEGGMFEQPISIFRTFSNYNYTKFPYTSTKEMGTLYVRTPLTKWYLDQFYVRGSAFTTYASSTSQELMYFPSACGMPPTFDDVSFNFTPFEGWPTPENRLHLLVRVSIPTLPTWNLTTAQYGYEPADWGQIQERVSVAEYLDAVKQGESYTGLPTESYQINGVSVRHVLPHNDPRPCDSATYEQYQWVKEGNLYSVQLTYKRDHILSDTERALVNQAVENLVLQTSYNAN